MKRRRSTAFYVECLLLTVFLLALTALLAQLFSAARRQTLQARWLTDAELLVQNVSEQFYAAEDEADFWALAGAGAPPAEGESCTLARAGAQGQAYQLKLSLAAEARPAGRLATLTAEVLAGAEGEQGSLCRLEFVRYWPE